jgi:hypothetical protein
MTLSCTISYSITENNKIFDYEKINQLFKTKYIKVGFPDGGKVGRATQEGSGHRKMTTISEIATNAAIQEYGSRNEKIPARPFIQAALNKNKDEIIKLMFELDKKVLSKEITVEDSLKVLGEALTSMIKQYIILLTEPANKPRTIKNKGFDKPLMDTNQMLDTVQFKVATK